MRPLVSRFSRCLLVVTLAAFAVPRPIAAQTGLASLAPGARVRVTAASLGPAARPARVVAASADALVLRPDGAAFDVTVPRTDITQLDVSVGRTTRKARMALLGAGAGAVVGLVAGAATYSDPCVDNPAVCAGWFYETRASDAFGGFLAGAVYGALAGVVTGQVWKKDKWEPRPLRLQGSTLRIVPAPKQGGVVALVMTVPVR